MQIGKIKEEEMGVNLEEKAKQFETKGKYPVTDFVAYVTTGHFTWADLRTRVSCYYGV